MNELDPATDRPSSAQDAPLNSYEQSQLKYLLSSLCEGMLDEAEAKHLQELLRRSEESRSTYIQ